MWKLRPADWVGQQCTYDDLDTTITEAIDQNKEQLRLVIQVSDQEQQEEVKSLLNIYHSTDIAIMLVHLDKAAPARVPGMVNKRLVFLSAHTTAIATDKCNLQHHAADSLPRLKQRQQQHSQPVAAPNTTPTSNLRFTILAKYAPEKHFRRALTETRAVMALWAQTLGSLQRP